VSRNIAFLFPGQGSQFLGMAADLAEAYPQVSETLAEVNQVLGFDLVQLMREGPAIELTTTEVAQPAILTHSVAICHLLSEADLKPAMVAGHSLGEYSALVAAGGVDFPEALKLVRERGLAMAEAGAQVGGVMAAILGLADAVAEEVVAQAAEEGVVLVANYNAPGQVVISGEPAAVERAEALAQEAGARGSIRLKVSGAFHSPLMQPAVERLGPLLEAADIRDAQVPLVSNIDAEPRQEAGGIRQALEKQLLGSVRWTESVRRMLDAGINCFVEVGPGEVLTKLMKRIDSEVEAINTSDVVGLQAALEQLT